MFVVLWEECKMKKPSAVTITRKSKAASIRQPGSSPDPVLGSIGTIRLIVVAGP
jgi:hypothetical protein